MRARTTSDRSLLRALGLAVMLPALALTGPTRVAAQDDFESSDDDEDEREEDLRGLYDSEGRRDPFVPTIGSLLEGVEGDCGQYRGELRGVRLAEVRLTSIMLMPTGPIAMFEGGPDRKGYFAGEGDRMCDGTVFAIDYETKTVTVRQKRDDPKRRLLRPYTDKVIRLYEDEDEAGGSNASRRSGRRGR